MRIHIISNSLRMNSGFSNVAKNLLLGLRKLGHEVSFTGMQTPYLSEWVNSIEILPITTFHVDELTQYTLNLKKNNPDAVIAIFQSDTGDLVHFPLAFKNTFWYTVVEGDILSFNSTDGYRRVVANGGKIVLPSKHGQIQAQKSGIKTYKIPYGFDNKIFKPLNLKDGKVREDDIKYCFYHTELGKIVSDPIKLCKQGCYSCTLERKDQAKCQYFQEEFVTILFFDKDSKKWSQKRIRISQLPNEYRDKFIFGHVKQNIGVRHRMERLLKAYSIFINQSRQIKDRTMLHIHCLIPESPIMTLDRGIQKIKDVKIGDRILTHKGRFMKVSQVMKREYSGDVIRITPKKMGIPITITPDHPVLAVKTELCRGINSRKGSICHPGRSCYHTVNYKRTKYCRYINGEEPYRKYKTDWIRAKDLNIGDFITYPKANNKIVDIEKIRIIDYIDDFLNVIGDSHNDDSVQTNIFGDFVERKITMYNSNKHIPAEVKLTSDLMRLFGYFIADGDHSGNSIEFTFNLGEEKYVEDIKEIMKNIFGLDHSYRMREHAHVMIYPSMILQNMFQNMFCPKEYVTKKGKGSKAKIVRIPPEFLDLPLDKLAELVKGEWRGDGTISDSGYSITTISETLANQLIYILSKFNILPALRIEKNSNRNHEDKFHIEIYGKDADIFDNIIGEIHPNRTNVKNKDSVYLKGKNLYYVPIRDIEIMKYVGDVWNLEIEEDNSYVSTIIVHNCMPIANNGINLIYIIESLGIENNIIFSYGDYMASSWSDNAMNILYNTFDCNISASSGEGYGIPTLESMACGTPQIGPESSAFIELIDDKETKIDDKEANKEIIGPRGILAKIATWQLIQDGSYRSLVDEEDLAKCMRLLYNGEHTKIYSKNGIKFSNQFSWVNICDQWNDLLKNIK